MIYNLAFKLFWGISVMGWMGIISLILLLSTAATGFLYVKRIVLIPFKWHVIAATATIIFAVLHFILGLSIQIGF